MAKTVIKVDLGSIESLRDAAKEIRNFEKRLSTKTARYMQRIAKLGETTAKTAFGDSITVAAVTTDRGVSIVANGKAIAFLEFGAGTATNPGDIFASQMPFEVSEGSWSRSEEGTGEFDRLGKWEFPKGSGRWMEFVTPRGGMQKAHDAIIRDAHKIAKEVFK